MQVLERVKDPLQTLVSRDHFETAYAVLAHFLLIAQRAPILFSGVRCLETCFSESAPPPSLTNKQSNWSCTSCQRVHFL